MFRFILWPLAKDGHSAVSVSSLKLFKIPNSPASRYAVARTVSVWGETCCCSDCLDMRDDIYGCVVLLKSSASV
jgi:hypothetical protein